MSNRTMLEINHDYYPHTDAGERAWLVNMLAYLRSGAPRNLPDGVTFFGMRHHSETCPMGDPPFGWNNEKVRS
jgi:hypothetical protein